MKKQTKDSAMTLGVTSLTLSAITFILLIAIMIFSAGLPETAMDAPPTAGENALMIMMLLFFVLVATTVILGIYALTIKTERVAAKICATLGLVFGVISGLVMILIIIVGLSVM
jgi:hypothetical protein